GCLVHLLLTPNSVLAILNTIFRNISNDVPFQVKQDGGLGCPQLLTTSAALFAQSGDTLLNS
ncbi:MAG: hypothetical protein AAFQ09_01505, partial [Pseudomonadota bacterium]